MTTSSYTVRKPCNHGLHLFLTIITLGMWGVFVWPFVAIVGRRETVRHHGPSPVPAPPNAVNPYNGKPYRDPYQGAGQTPYPPSVP